MSILMRRRLALFHDVQREAMFQLHARRTKNRAHRTCRSTLFSNHLANVALRDAQSDDSCIAVGNRLDGDIVWVIYQRTGYLSH